MKNKESNKKILYLSPFFYPELISTGKYNTYLVNKLVDDGNTLNVITSYPLYPGWKATFSDEQLTGVQIIRGGLHVIYPRSAVFRRLVLEIWFTCFTVLNMRKLRNNVDVVVAIFPPNLFFLFINFILPKHVYRVGIVHDVQGVMAESTKSYFRKFVGAMISRLEQRVFNVCDRVVCLSESMRYFLTEAYGIPVEKCEVHYPFVTSDNDGTSIDELFELFPKEFRHVVYSGALGEKQKPYALFDLFRNISLADSKVMCHIFSGGPMFEELKQISRKTDTQHIIFHDLVPDSQVRYLYKHSNVQVVPQAEGTSAGAFPSKLPNLLASGVPIFIICDDGSELSNLVKDVKTVHISNSWDMNANAKDMLNFLTGIVAYSHEENAETNKDLIMQKFDSRNLVQTISAQ